MQTSLFLKTSSVVWEKALPVYLFCHLNTTMEKTRNGLMHCSTKALRTVPVWGTPLTGYNSQEKFHVGQIGGYSCVTD